MWILVVDDDRPIAELICEFLQDEGYSARACPSAAAAWQTLQEATPALVITDLWMEARESGFALVHQIRSVPTLKSVPIILCAANRQFLQAHAAELRQLDCLVLEKPFNLEDLLAKVQEVLALTKATIA